MFHRFCEQQRNNWQIPIKHPVVSLVFWLPSRPHVLQGTLATVNYKYGSRVSRSDSIMPRECGPGTVSV